MRFSRPAAHLVPNLSRWTDVYLGLGGNVGDRLRHLQQGVLALALHPEMKLVGLSRLYETEYVGPGRQNPYLNACAHLVTHLPPRVLLSVLKSIELRCQRLADTHQQPRTLDLDILLYGDRQLEESGLIVPHPRLQERAFVLEPLAEIAPGQKIPNSRETVATACAKIRRKDGPWLMIRDDLDLLPILPNEDKEDWRAALAVHCR